MATDLPATGTRRLTAPLVVQATERPSPNHNERVGCSDPTLIVLHYTAMQTADAALERLCDPVHEVSAHYLIDRTGQLHRLVPEERRAWHAGQGSWGNAGDVNSRSLGIELDNDGTGPFGPELMTTLEGLLAQLLTRYALQPEAVIGHQDMAPDRKEDPGAFFDWRRLADRGLSVWPEPDSGSAPDPVVFHRALSRFGYPVPPEVSSEGLLKAFRDRFRPRHSGPLDSQDMGLAADLALRFPFDRKIANP